MNKIIGGILIIGGIAAAIGYAVVSNDQAPQAENAGTVPTVSDAVPTGVTREITITVQKLRWSFTPEVIEVNRGDTVVLTLVNEDDFYHGFTVDALGVSKQVPANETVKLSFVADTAGDFPFYCSVPCGKGEVGGETRGHFDMTGKLHVRSFLSEAY